MSSRSSFPIRSAGWLLPSLAVLAATVAGLQEGLPWALWVLASAVLLLTILLLWSSVLALTARPSLTLEDALDLAAPTAEDDQKRALLQALKDLDYELSVGKISEADHRQLSGEYRRRAKLLLRQLDSSMGPMRKRAAGLLSKRLAAENLPPRDASPPASPDHTDNTETPT